MSFEQSASPVITGNRISENWAWYGGGGILCRYGGAPMISGNIISHNTAEYGGGGILCDGDVNAVIEHNLVMMNTADYDGGGISCMNYSPGAAPGIINNFVCGNIAGYGGGGIYVGNGFAGPCMNNTIHGNMAKGAGGGFRSFGASPKIENCIIWGNTRHKPGSQSDLSIYGGNAVVQYCDIRGGWPGTGNIDADPLFVQGSRGFFCLSQVAAGQGSDSPCVDAGGDLASNLGMDALWTRSDEGPDAGTVDMGYHYGPFLYPRLSADAAAIPISAGGQVNFILNAASANAGRKYHLLGSLTGTEPGLPLPGGKATLPLNWDFFTEFVLDFANTPLFHDFSGILNAAGGTAAAALDTLGPMPPQALGITFYFAYLLHEPFDFVSNPVMITFVP